MKYRITFKDPCASVEDQTGKILEGPEKLPAKAREWLEFDEYLTVEYDSMTKVMTAIRPDTASWDPVDNEKALLEEALAINTPGHLRALGVLLRTDYIEVPGKGGNIYVVRRYSDGKHFCSCPSMKFESGTDDDGYCKHIRATSGGEDVIWKIVREKDHDVEEDQVRLHDWGSSEGDGASA